MISDEVNNNDFGTRRHGITSVRDCTRTNPNRSLCDGNGLFSRQPWVFRLQILKSALILQHGENKHAPIRCIIRQAGKLWRVAPGWVESFPSPPNRTLKVYWKCKKEQRKVNELWVIVAGAKWLIVDIYEIVRTVRKETRIAVKSYL